MDSVRANASFRGDDALVPASTSTRERLLVASTEESVFVLRSIRFATPPVDELRWRGRGGLNGAEAALSWPPLEETNDCVVFPRELDMLSTSPDVVCLGDRPAASTDCLETNELRLAHPGPRV